MYLVEFEDEEALRERLARLSSCTGQQLIASLLNVDLAPINNAGGGSRIPVAKSARSFIWKGFE